MIELDDFLEANPDARVHGPRFASEFSGYCFDSRIVRPGQLFLAVRTAKGDGHDHIEAACRGGATGAVCKQPADLASMGCTCIVVPDTRLAIAAFARWRVADVGVRVVAVTGSAGKTSTKEAIAHVLAGTLRVFRNAGNYSGRYGLPIALGDLESHHQVAVLEMACDHFGEMAVLTEMAPPEVGAVTVVAPAHLEAFGDLEGVAREKGGLVAALPPGGLAILNQDDPRVAAMAARSRAPVAWVGAGGDYSAHDVTMGATGTRFLLASPTGEARVHLPWLGTHFISAALIAAAVGEHFGLAVDEIARRLATVPLVPGRLRPLPGRRQSLILDDSYNASPEAVMAGLDVLAALEAPRRIAVIGEMAELGEAAEDGHRRVGRRAAEVVDTLVTKGKAGEWIAEAAREAGLPSSAVRVTYTADDATAAAAEALVPGAVVLVKGSAVARTEQVVAGLMAEPERAAELLVRQDAAWRQLVVLRPERPTWLEVDLGAIGSNVAQLVRAAGGAKVLAVLKADAYGHGAVQVAHTALHHGAWGLAVACLPEAVVLREAGIDAPILVLGYTPAWQARDAARLGASVAVFDEATAQALSAAALGLDRTVSVHVKVDTGMHRLGVAPDDVVAFLKHLSELPGLETEGLFTHFAEADDVSGPGRTATERQLTAFQRVLSEVEEHGLRPPVVHAANSAALLGLPAARFDAVRPGIAMYGLAPSDGVRPEWLRPALAWKTQLAQIRDVAPGEGVGYGGAWRPDRPSRIATLPVGYADGFRRGPRTWRYVLVRGQPAQVVGRVSMDQATVDVTDVVDARQGDEAVLIGRQGDNAITAEQVADWLGTINYEVVAAILARVPRVA